MADGEIGRREAAAASDRARLAWLSALDAHIGAAKAHAKAAALLARSGRHPEYVQTELDRFSAERREFDAELARHPEWTSHAPDWPLLEPDPD